MITTNKIIFLSLLLFSTFLYSQEIVTDRPDQTESSSTVGKKVFQMELGSTYLTFSDIGYKGFLIPQMLLRYGITNGIELRLATQYEASKFGNAENKSSNNGLTDVQIGAKFQLLKKENVKTEIAFLSHILLPFSQENLLINEVGVVNKLSISHPISNRFGAGLNIGYDYLESTNFLTYSLAIGFGISEVVGFYMEPFGIWGESNIYESNFDVGFTFLLNPNTQLDASYGFGLNNNMNYYSIGFSWKVPSKSEVK